MELDPAVVLAADVSRSIDDGGLVLERGSDGVDRDKRTIRGFRGKDPRDPAVTLGRRGRQDWAGRLPSSIARERQKSALSGH
jgi:hypothetical protein